MLCTKCRPVQYLDNPTWGCHSSPMTDWSDTMCMQHPMITNQLPCQVACQSTDQEVNYKQKIIVRWLKAPTPPPPAPIIIREIQPPPIVEPPIIYRQMAPCPPTPPPIIVREQPPPCPQPRRTVIIEKRLPPVCVPRRIICERPRPVPQPVTVCATKQQQCISLPQSQVIQQRVPVYGTQRRIVQPRGIRVIRQVIGPAQPTAIGSVGLQQPVQGMYSSLGRF